MVGYSPMMCALVIAIWIAHDHGIFGQMCSSRGNFQNVREDMVITGSTFLTLSDVGLVGCSKKCLLRSACQSFNYKSGTKECQLNKNSSSNTESGNVKTAVGMIASDINSWSPKIAGACSTRHCPEHSACLEENENTACKVECSNPTLQNGSFTSPISSDAGDELTFECDDGFKAIGNAKCQADGSWSLFKCIQGCVNPPNVLNAELITSGDDWPTGTVLEYECKSSLDKVDHVSCLSDGTWTEMKCVARNCSSLLQCNNALSDGEYWLYPEVLYDKPVKIYCHDMNTGNPLEYLTFPEENYVDYSDVPCDHSLDDCKPTMFNKVRIEDIGNLLTHRLGLSDHHFSNKSTRCSDVYFASVHDCNAECNNKKTTNFIVNTNGTGLKIHPDQQWGSETSSTHLLDPVTIEKTDSGRLIEIRCHQFCEYCYPLPVTVYTLTFVLDEFQSVDSSNVISPSCLHAI